MEQKTKKGYYGKNNPTNDRKLIDKIDAMLTSPDYKRDMMTDQIREYVNRYKKIKSLTDKMRYQIKVHIEKHQYDSKGE